MVWNAALCVYLIPWPRKYRFRPPNHDPTWSNFRDIGNLRSCGGHFEKCPNLIVSPIFFLETSIWFLRVPWTKWYHSRRIMGGVGWVGLGGGGVVGGEWGWWGGGGGGGAWGPPFSSWTKSCCFDSKLTCQVPMQSSAKNSFDSSTNFRRQKLCPIR